MRADIQKWFNERFKTSPSHYGQKKWIPILTWVRKSKHLDGIWQLFKLNPVSLSSNQNDNICNFSSSKYVIQWLQQQVMKPHKKMNAKKVNSSFSIFFKTFHRPWMYHPPMYHHMYHLCTILGGTSTYVPP